MFRVTRCAEEEDGTVHYRFVIVLLLVVAENLVIGSSLMHRGLMLAHGCQYSPSPEIRQLFVALSIESDTDPHVRYAW